MEATNPRLVGLWVARWGGLKGSPVTCLGCHRIVPPREKVYRLRPEMGIEPYGRERVVGYLCRLCRQALSPAKKGRYFTRIEG